MKPSHPAFPASKAFVAASQAVRDRRRWKRAQSTRWPSCNLCLVLLASAFANSLSGGSSVLEWNGSVLDAVRAECTPPPLAARNLAILHLTLETACADPSRTPVRVPIAACESASALFPGRRAEFERLRDQQLAHPKAPGTSATDWIGARVLAERFVNDRATDGASRFVNYVPRTGFGQWRRTPPFFRPPELPQWPDLRPFALVEPERLMLISSVRPERLAYNNSRKSSQHRIRFHASHS